MSSRLVGAGGERIKSVFCLETLHAEKSLSFPLEDAPFVLSRS